MFSSCPLHPCPLLSRGDEKIVEGWRGEMRRGDEGGVKKGEEEREGEDRRGVEKR